MKSLATVLIVISLSFGEHAFAQHAIQNLNNGLQPNDNDNNIPSGQQQPVLTPDDSKNQLTVITGGLPASYSDLTWINPGEHSSHPFFLLSNDGGITGINSVPGFQCDYSIVPSVVIENFGSVEMTSATLEYFIDGGTPSYYYWQGSLPPFWMDTILLPTINVSSGNHTLNILVTEANGEMDFNNGNNGSIQFNVVGASQPTPYVETFELPMMPSGFFVENPNGGPTWNTVSLGDENSVVNCIRMPFYINDVSGDVDDLYMRNVDLSNVGQAYMSFDVAYAYYSDFYWDELKVIVSTDCGNNWDVVYDKAKNDLATAPVTDIFFYPASNEWRNEEIDLQPYIGNSNVMISFDAVSGHGNNLYIDNIAINDNVGVSEVSVGKNALRLYPNPASDVVNVSFPSMNSSGSEIAVLNALGQQVFASKEKTSNHILIPVDQFVSGSYLVTVSDNAGNVSASPLIVFH